MSEQVKDATYLRNKYILLRDIQYPPKDPEHVADMREAWRVAKQLTEEKRQLLAALESVEWISFVYGGEKRCPVCGNTKSNGGHYDDCKLAAALKAAQPAPTRTLEDDFRVAAQEALYDVGATDDELDALAPDVMDAVMSDHTESMSHAAQRILEQHRKEARLSA